MNHPEDPLVGDHGHAPFDHTAACFLPWVEPKYLSRWAWLRYPRVSAELRRQVRLRVLVAMPGEEASSGLFKYSAARRFSLMLAIYSVFLASGSWWAIVPLGLAVLLVASSDSPQRVSLAYREGWAEGRIAMVLRTGFYDTPDQWLRTELERDAAVVMHQAPHVPDDLSSLFNDGDKDDGKG